MSRLFEEDVILKLTSDADVFADILHGHIFDIAKNYRCIASVSKKRLDECRNFWLEDINRALTESFPADFYRQEPESGDHTLDIYKYAAFLSFWLRRFTPITKITFIMTLGEQSRGELRSEHARFAVFGNEVAALLVGVHLCVSHSLRVLNERAREEDNICVHQAYRERVSNIFPTWLSMRDFVMVLKHKHVSPHALFLVYKSLFLNPYVP